MKSLIHRLFAVAIAALPLADVGSAAELHPQMPMSRRSPIPAESFDDLLKEGKAFEKQFQATDALPLYLAAEKLEPKNPELLVRIARQYRYLMTDASDTPEKLRLGRMALEYSMRAAACGPKDCDAQLAPAITLGKMLPYLPTKQQIVASPQIKQSVDKALAIDSRNDNAWHILGRWNRVLAEVSSAKRFVAGLIYGQLPQGSYEDAEKAMKKAIALNPHRLMHYIELGRIYAQMGRKEEARQFINKGLAMPDTEKDDSETKQRGRETLAKL
ncbi:MAG TPA: tetratricopeptide repeat protein [Candidatus Udaeobacter sp.]|jgi:tetratricopeptide (TPR) repeat protein